MRPTFAALLLLLSISCPAGAQDAKPKPNTLTPKEIADGWILLFDGETTFGWDSGKLKVADHALDLSDVGTGQVISTTMFREFEMKFEYRGSGGPPGSLPADAGARSGSLQFFTGLHMAKDWTPAKIRVDLAKIQVEQGDGGNAGAWSGPAAILFSQKEKSKFQVRNLKLRPQAMKSLFNGKDLAGWKVFPGDKYKSKFTVTDKGEINLQNGPGDLQTVGKYKDFVMQLECISHGKHLNSGIFFRCRDNEYQNGYEAQIRNQFTPEPTQDYTIEVFDPMTHKLLEKKKIKSTAYDYGTGAIYRRQPARKEMSKDGEWFTMTIVAHGNHFSTWVNGVQVTDWYDNRPRTDNARTGCRLEAGHISIQGHDPTTNLSFRNLRIASFAD
jgi:hypothetical protein